MMKSSHIFVILGLCIISQFVAHVRCVDKLFIADFNDDAIYMMESDGNTFVNSSLVSLNLTGLDAPLGVEYDHRTDIVYWTDGILHTVNRAAVNGSFQEVLYQLPDSRIHDEYPHGIALDLDQDKVYWVDQSRGVIEMANLDGTDRQQILNTGSNTSPIAIVFSHFQRKIFWTVSGADSKIEMANPDGSGREILVETPFGSLWGICLDFSERNLYWTDAANDTIERIHLESKNRGSTQFTHPTVPDLLPYGVAKYYEDIYFTDLRIGGVFAVDSDINIHLVGNRVSSHAEIHIYADSNCDGSNICTSGTCVIVRKQRTHAACICPPGVTGSRCEIDINDCDPSPCVRGTCNDTGTLLYNCTCDPGFTGANCDMDINECLQPNVCGINEECTNTEGGYNCTCSANFEIKGGICMDINECLQPNVCGINEECTNTDGGYNCTCSANFNRKGGTCMDINECLQPNVCGINEECTNTEGGYNCTCSANFERKGGTCTVTQSVGGSVRFSRLNGQAVSFSVKLNDPMTDDYRNMATQCRTIINNVVYGLMKTSTSPWEVSINGFTGGSIIVDFEIMIFEISRDLLQTRAAMVETSLGDQNTGLWTSADNSVSITVDSVIAYGSLCLVERCGLYGSCRTRPGVSDYRCECLPGYTGQHCETVVTCDLPNLPFSHVLDPQGDYMGGNLVTIQCDEKDASFVWTCNGTSGEWEKLASVDCEDEPSVFPTAGIIGIAVGFLLVIIIGMVLFFLYKFAGKKQPRPRVDDVNRANSRSNNYESNLSGASAVSYHPGPEKGFDDGIYNPGGDFSLGNDVLYEAPDRVRLGTLPSIPAPTIPASSRGEANPATPSQGATAAPGFSGSQPPLYSIHDPNGNGNMYESAIGAFRPRTTTEDASPSPLLTKSHGAFGRTPETTSQNTNPPAMSDDDGDYILLTGGVASVHIA